LPSSFKTTVFSWGKDNDAILIDVNAMKEAKRY